MTLDNQTKNPLNLEIKKQVVERLLRNKQDEFAAMQSFQSQQLASISDENQDNGQIIESPIEETMQSLELYTGSMDQLAQEIIMLKEVDMSIAHDRISVGSLIKMQNLLFLVAVPARKFTLPDYDVYGISNGSPIYLAMEGLQKADRCMFGQIDYYIEDIV